MYIYVYEQTYAYTYIRTYICALAHLCMQVYKLYNVYTYARTNVPMYIHVLYNVRRKICNIRTYVCTYIMFMHACTYVWTYIHIYAFTMLCSHKYVYVTAWLCKNPPCLCANFDLFLTSKSQKLYMIECNIVYIL